MSRPLPVLLGLSLVTASFACGKLKVVSVPEPGEEATREAEPPTARPVAESGATWASQLAFESCRSEIARRWRVSETRVRTSTRAHDAREGVDMVNWEVQGGAAGYCRVDARGTVLNVETERSPTQPPPVATQPPAPEPPPAAPAETGNDSDPSADDAEPPQVKRQQLEACRSTVVREMGAKPDDVGLSAGAPDERGTVLIDWSLGTGREGTCLVDASWTVVQFRR